MLTILDRYILKRYLITFMGMLLLFVPIGIMANLAEKIGKIIDNEAPDRTMRGCIASGRP